MWFRPYLDPAARAAPWAGLAGMLVLPIVASAPEQTYVPAMIVGIPLAVTGFAMAIARTIWVINKTALTDGGPDLPDPGTLNHRPMRTRWFGLYGFDRSLFLLICALIIEQGLLGGHDAPREAGLWLWCVAVYLIGAANYTRTHPPETDGTGEAPNA